MTGLTRGRAHTPGIRCDYRRRICEFVSKNWAQWEERVLLCHGLTMTQPLYIETMVNGTGWGTACEIEAASVLLGCQITVWLRGYHPQEMTSGRFWQQNFTTDAAKENPTIIELLLSDQHFQLLRKLPNPNDSKLSNAKQVRTSTEHNYAKKEKSVNQLKRGSNRDLQFDFESCAPGIPDAKQVTSEHNYVKQDKNYKQLKRGSDRDVQFF